MPSKTRNKRKVKRKVKGKSKQARRQLQNTRDSGALKWRRRLPRAKYLALTKSKKINPESLPKTKTHRTSRSKALITRNPKTHPKNEFSITTNPID